MFERDHGYRAIGTRFGMAFSFQKEYIPKRIHTVSTTQNIISKPTNQLSVRIFKWKPPCTGFEIWSSKKENFNFPKLLNGSSLNTITFNINPDWLNFVGDFLKIYDQNPEEKGPNCRSCRGMMCGESWGLTVSSRLDTTSSVNPNPNKELARENAGIDSNIFHTICRLRRAQDCFVRQKSKLKIELENWIWFYFFQWMAEDAWMEGIHESAPSTSKALEM